VLGKRRTKCNALTFTIVSHVVTDLNHQPRGWAACDDAPRNHLQQKNLSSIIMFTLLTT
jgi:hypothetical protein